MGLIEAAACGLPAVATDVPGTAEVVADGLTGWLAPPRSLTALAGKISDLMKVTETERRAMGEHARLRVIERFSLELALNRWEALYGELLERNPLPRRWAGVA